jgi:hypothetical protein
MSLFMESFHFVAEILYYINPVMMMIACCLWISLYSKSNRYQDKIIMRCYVLERQIEVILENYVIDKREIEMFERLRKMYE